MSRVWLRASLVIIMLGVAAASGYQVFLTEQQIDDGLEADRAFAAHAWSLAVSPSDLRAAQQAYVAAGQDRGSWVENVTDHLDTITTSLGNLTSISTAPGTINALEQAASSIENLQQMDELARSAAGHVERARVRERGTRSRYRLFPRGAC